VRALRRGGARQAQLVAQRRELDAQARQQPRQAPEVAQAGLHLGQHHMVAAERHGRREAESHVGHGRQRGVVAPGVGLAKACLRRERERRGALLAGPNAALSGSFIRRNDAVPIDQCHGAHRVDLVEVVHHPVGRQRLRRQRGDEGFQRQRRQVDADPEHGEISAWIMRWWTRPARSCACAGA
jgi:hypothetical protein